MPIKLVLGLGNPGEVYATTRHNVGFRVVDRLRLRRAGAPWWPGTDCEHAVAVIGGPVVLARPLAFMNRSGVVAAELLGKLDLDPENMLVVVDDVDLPLGNLRLKTSGGPGTHNGLRDVVAKVGGSFPRLRIGVRGQGPVGDLADYVLAPFADGEKVLAEESYERAVDAVEAALRVGIERAMNEFNRTPDAPRPQ